MIGKLAERESREVLRMNNKLSEMQNTIKTDDIANYLNDLHALASIFANDKKWYQSFINLWGELEIENSLALAEELSELESEQREQKDILCKKLEKHIGLKYALIPEEFLWWNN